MKKKANKKIIKKFETSIISIMLLISGISVIMLAAMPAMACHYNVGTFESDYSTEKTTFYLGETVYGKGSESGWSYNLKLRISDPDGTIVYNSSEGKPVITGFYELDYTAKTGVWYLQLGIYKDGYWQWPTDLNSDRNASFTVTDVNFSLTVNIDGDGSVDKNPDKIGYHYNEVVELTAIPGSCYSFSHWSGDLIGSDNPAEIVMNESKTVTAHFVQNYYTLTVNIVGNGSVTIDPPPSSEINKYECGTLVNLTATPDEGHIFSHWEGDTDCSEAAPCDCNPLQIIMLCNRNITAYFVPENDFFRLRVDVDGDGSVDIDPDIPLYESGTLVNLTAKANSGWSFINWTGDLNSDNSSESIVMDSDKSVVAHFGQNQVLYTLTVIIDGCGSVEINPEQEGYLHGTLVNLTAKPDSGYTFDHWSGNLSGSNSTEQINMTEDKNVTAHFVKTESGDPPGGDPPFYLPTIGEDPDDEVPPVAVAGGPYTGTEREKITFNGSDSYDPDHSIVSYHWDFGDGKTGDGSIVTHSYPLAGEYTVVLTVTDNEDLTDSNKTVVSITDINDPPTDPKITGPTEGDVDGNYRFSFVSEDDGKRIEYIIEWGDLFTTESESTIPSHVFKASHTWIKPGIYTIKVTAFDGENEATTELQIEIQEPDVPETPEENNFILIILALLALMFLLLFLLLAKKSKKDDEEQS